MRFLMSAAIIASLALPTTSFAQDAAVTTVAATTATPGAMAVAPRSGQAVFFSSGRRLGSISRIMDNGDLRVISEMKMVSVPASSLSMANNRLVTSLTRADVARQK
jgi:hypothetical protein